MTTERKKQLAKAATIKIFATILEEHNGYTPEEIKKKKMAEECEGADIWDKIYNSVYSVIGKK